MQSISECLYSHLKRLDEGERHKTKNRRQCEYRYDVNEGFAVISLPQNLPTNKFSTRY